MTTIALFDLDKTLLAGDSDHGWGEFLSSCNYVDPAFYKERNDFFYGQYGAGTLDIFDYCAFSFKVLADNPPELLKQWRDEYLDQCIAPMIRPQALALVQKHQKAGHTVILTTATNDFVTAPIAAKLGISHLIATRAQCIDGRYTGQVEGLPNFKDGKVARFHEWLATQGLTLENISASFVYSDSINDAPLLELATFAVATNPDARLKQLAFEKHWPVLELFNGELA